MLALEEVQNEVGVGLRDGLQFLRAPGRQKISLLEAPGEGTACQVSLRREALDPELKVWSLGRNSGTGAVLAIWWVAY